MEFGECSLRKHWAGHCRFFVWIPEVYMDGGGVLCESLKFCVIIVCMCKCAFPGKKVHRFHQIFKDVMTSRA